MTERFNSTYTPMEILKTDDSAKSLIMKGEISLKTDRELEISVMQSNVYSKRSINEETEQNKNKNLKSIIMASEGQSITQHIVTNQ